MQEGEEVGDGRAEGSSATGDGAQAAVSLMSDDDTASGALLESDACSHLSRFVCRGPSVLMYCMPQLPHLLKQNL